jgi:pimeloyl-ACP methyl ester carboxylesterase
MQPLVLFAHGKESGPWGGKIRHLASIAEQNGCRVSSLDYQGIASPDDRVDFLLSHELGPYSKLIMVGSSMGGYVSIVASRTLQPDGLFLMAPAINLPGYKEQYPVAAAGAACLVFGWQDEAIPLANGIKFAQMMQAQMHILPSSHRLLNVLPQVGELFNLFLREVL